jgi:hypothetical protein
MPRFTTDGGPIDMTLALALRRGKRGLVTVRARLLTSEGEQLDPDGFTTVWGGMPIAFGVVVPTRGIETRVMLDAFGLLLPAGAYRWDLEIDGKAVKPCRFAVEVVA